MLWYKAAVFILEAGAKISTACPVKTAFTLVHPGNLIVFYQSGWPFEPFKSSDRKRVWVIPGVIAIIRCEYACHRKLLFF
jgi:hypothetical protein